VNVLDGSCGWNTFCISVHLSREREIRICVQPSPRDAARNPQGKGWQQFSGG
jgi:hypothetical protein